MLAVLLNRSLCLSVRYYMCYMFVRRFETQGIRIYNFRYYCLIRSLPLEISDMTPFAKDFLFAYVASLKRRHYDVKFEL